MRTDKAKYLTIAILLATMPTAWGQSRKAEKTSARYEINNYGMPLLFNGYLAPDSAYLKIAEPAWPAYRGMVTAVPDTINSAEYLLVEVEQVAAPAYSTPQWLADNLASAQLRNRLVYDYMLSHPEKILGSYATLYKAPEIPRQQQPTVEEALNDIPLPEIGNMEAQVVTIPPKRRHWLHDIKGAVQFSQAYLSPNWYQGGNNHLSLVVDALWDVQLNKVYHPNLMFQNTVSYKLAINSSPQDTHHSYNISEDLFQWNMRFGVKAWEKWFYSFTSQFKTQLLNNYEQNSPVRRTSFLSPGDLTLGLGMTYSTVNKKETFKLNLSISPISYNLKTCIDSMVSPTSIGLKNGEKFSSQIGSNAELTFDWKIASNISYRSRVFLFSDYSYFLGDWENTMSFSINRFLSTQLYWRMRYDTSTPSAEKWGHWMLKEILSFGFSYTFNTKV